MAYIYSNVHLADLIGKLWFDVLLVVRIHYGIFVPVVVSCASCLYKRQGRRMQSFKILS